MRRRVFLMDAVAIYIAVFTAYVVRFGVDELSLHDLTAQRIGSNYAIISLILFVVWLLVLYLGGTNEVGIMGSGALEYSRVIRVSLGLFAVIAIFSYVIRWQLARGFVALALPIGLLLLLIGRRYMRTRLVRERRNGESMQRALVVASHVGADPLVASMTRYTAAGLTPVALCYIDCDEPQWQSQATVGGKAGTLPEIGNLSAVAPFLAGKTVDAVVVANSDSISAQQLKQLEWDCEPTGTALVLAPGVSDIAPARIKSRPMPGTTLLAVDPPGYTSRQQVLKRVFDLAGGLLLVILFSLPMLVTAIAIKATSKGPVFFKQERMGENGQTFKVFKFRSMRVDQDEKAWDAARIAGQVDDGSGGFNKPKNDPRITSVGRVIRRFSIDELPQLFNVVAGQMSLVGPRPFLAADHALFGNLGERRLLVKPGMTGLWQVSGRSNLSAAESARLDLYYVDNWSMMEDLMILFRTAKAVVGSDGAY